jgi:hypothetical protein
MDVCIHGTLDNSRTVETAAGKAILVRAARFLGQSPWRRWSMNATMVVPVIIYVVFVPLGCDDDINSPIPIFISLGVMCSLAKTRQMRDIQDIR